MIPALPPSPIPSAKAIDRILEPAATAEALFAALFTQVRAPGETAEAVTQDDAATEPETQQDADPLACLPLLGALTAPAQTAPVTSGPAEQNHSPAPSREYSGSVPLNQSLVDGIALAAATLQTPAADQGQPLPADQGTAALAALKAMAIPAQAAATPAPADPSPPQPVLAEENSRANPAAVPMAVAPASEGVPPKAGRTRVRSDGGMSGLAARVDHSRVADPGLADVASTTAFTSPGAPIATGAAGYPDPASVQPPLSEALTQHRLDLAHDGAWLDRLALDIARTAANDGQLRFQLNPEHLGSLHVALDRGTDGTSVRLTADSEAARTILADAQPRLIAEARAQGLRISETHVDLAGSGHGHRHSPAQPEGLVRTAREAVNPEKSEPQRGHQERYA